MNKYDGRKAPMSAFLESAGVTLEGSGSAKLKASGYMDLTVEWWASQKTAGAIEVSVCHYGEQNGDAMRDPEMVFVVIPKLGLEVPSYYRNDYVGIEQEVFFEKDGQQFIRPKLKSELQAFAKIWARNLKEQGHKRVLEATA